MEYFKTKLLFLFLLNNFANSDLPIISNLLCALSIPATPLSLPDLKQLLCFIKSQAFYGPKLVDDVLVSETQVLKDVAEFNSGKDNEDIHMYITDLIEKYGYNCEEHKVVTPDGYILTMQRVPGEGDVVFVMHGIFSSADDFVTAGPDNAIVYALAAAGYDVWLGNARGNKHSRQHETLSPDCAEFWDFSWDEIGRIDLPTMIDYVLDTTGQSKVTYIGHSQGTTTFFVMASMLPEYNDKVSVMIALAPIVYMGRVRSPIPRVLGLNTDLEYLLVKAIGVNEIAPYDFFTQAIATVLCGNNALGKIVCSNLAFITTGFDLGQVNVTNLPVNLGHTPAGASTKQLVHYGQEVASQRFCRFDNGKTKNEELYGSESPPDYPLDKVITPVALFYSNNDWISNDTDVARLRDNLPNVIDFHLYDHYCHVDYIWGKNINETVNERVLGLIKKYMETC